MTARKLPHADSQQPPPHPKIADNPPACPAKVQAWHLDRLAVVYVRQSTPQQVCENTESTQRQYALVKRAVDLGWPADRVLVIDEDQGRSGATAEGRLGFQRLLAEVALDHVGLILGLEMSRLARSCRDWHQLLELCGVFRTLLADQDGLYDPTDHNDRLLLGLAGIMSEAELHVLQRRMHEGKRNKALRGELFTVPPIGYVKLPTGGFGLDPDEQARSVVGLVFDQFERLGTARKVLNYLLDHHIRIGVRPHAGPNRGQLEWHAATRDAVIGILRHPIYAGYYCHGRRRTDPRRKRPGKPGSGRVTVASDKYVALLPDRCPAYITRERYEAVQRRLTENRARVESKGAPREGPSLLGGLVTCARCARRMAIHYAGRARTLRYVCRSGATGCADTPRGIMGRVVDELVAGQVLVALQPGALELSLAAADDVLREREQREGNWRQQLERARYQADRAERQYRAVEPENRLVARTLERQWEEALQEVRRLEEDHERYRRQQPTTLTDHEVEHIRALSQDLPALWLAPTTMSADRQQIIRFLVERVAVDVSQQTDQARVAVTWVGGHVSEHGVVRPVLRYEQTVGYSRLLARISELRAQGVSFATAAERLNAEGYRPLKQAERFDGDMVGRIFRRTSPSQPRGTKWRAGLQPGEWLVTDLVTELGIPKSTLHTWIRLGWIHYRRLTGYRAPCVCWADGNELQRLRRLRQTPRGWWDPTVPAELTTPACRPEG